MPAHKVPPVLRNTLTWAGGDEPGGSQATLGASTYNTGDISRDYLAECVDRRQRLGPGRLSAVTFSSPGPPSGVEALFIGPETHSSDPAG